jgi:hypothetical protein
LALFVQPVPPVARRKLEVGSVKQEDPQGLDAGSSNFKLDTLHLALLFKLVE